MAPAWPWATRLVPSSGSTAMSIRGTSTRSAPVRPTRSPMYSIGASSRSPSPITIRPAKSISSIVWRIASVAAASAWSFSPRPMNRDASIAAASVTRIISRASSCSISSEPRMGRSAGASARRVGVRERAHPKVRERGTGPPNAAGAPDQRPPSMSEVPAAGEDHRQVMPIRHFDGHLVADRAAGLDDRRHAGARCGLDAIREREVRVRGEDRELRPVSGPADGDLDRDLTAGLTGPDPDCCAVPRKDDRVRADMADGTPAEEQVRQLLERGPAPCHDLEAATVEPEIVDALDEQAARDALEVEARDPVVAHSLGRVWRDGQQLDPGLAPEDADGRLAEARSDDGLVGIGGDLARGRTIELPVDPDDPAERRDRVRLEG